MADTLKAEYSGMTEAHAVLQGQLDIQANEYMTLQNGLDSLYAVFNGTGKSSFETAMTYIQAELALRMKEIKQLQTDILSAQETISQTDNELAVE